MSGESYKYQDVHCVCMHIHVCVRVPNDYLADLKHAGIQVNVYMASIWPH